MEKYIRVSDLGKDKPKIATAEEIADAVRGVGEWVWNGANYVCTHCLCGSRENSRFCKFCGSRNVG